MPCKCHRVVCEEHAAEFRPFEEPCVGVTIAPPNALNVCWWVSYAQLQGFEIPSPPLYSANGAPAVIERLDAKPSLETPFVVMRRAGLGELAAGGTPPAPWGVVQR